MVNGIRTTQNSATVEVFSILGNRLILRKGFHDHDQIDISNLAPGKYIIRINTTKEIVTGSFVKINP